MTRFMYNCLKKNGYHTDNMNKIHNSDRSDWIPVNDKLPAPLVNVLIVTQSLEGPVVDLGYRTSKGTWYQVDTEILPVTVTHWQHLPEPPKEGVAYSDLGRGISPRME